MDLHLYFVLSSDLIFEMLKILPDPTNVSPLNQLKFRAGVFESLLQFRVTESPSTISPDGLMDTDRFFGGSKKSSNYSLTRPIKICNTNC